ncbi:hypothetical protein HanHA89_Chr06g0236591 [Helianthus annuus]|nr:hypothetical protein HanHA89_Chr06g0236591 [Helianthus annuus]
MQLRCVPELKIPPLPSPPLPSPPCLSKLERLFSGKKNPIFPPLPLLSGSLEHHFPSPPLPSPPPVK